MSSLPESKEGETNTTQKSATLSIRDIGAIRMVERIRILGASSSLSLPTVVLCGSQSCGKSSLTESLAGVSLPRSASTCTRCATEIRVHGESSQWECVVKLRVDFADDGSKLAPQRVSEHEFGRTADKAEVSALVSGAQRSILGGSQFSRNTVIVQVSDPGAANLTVVDLPGLISATESSDDERYIGLVSDLVRAAISPPSALIAAVIACSSDVENQPIFRMAREVDPEGQRTLGVLTKPDCIEEGLHGGWLDMLSQRRYPLKLGYCVLRNPSAHHLRKGQSGERERIERDFFDSTPPWNDLPAPLRQRCGATSLTRLLCDSLSSLIVRQLPSMMEQVSRQIIHTRAQLTQLPRPMAVFEGGLPESSEERVLDLAMRFSDAIKQAVHREEDSPLWKPLMRELHAFFDRLSSMRPRFCRSRSQFRSEHPHLFEPCQPGPPVLFTLGEVVEKKRQMRIVSLFHCARLNFVRESMEPWNQTSRTLVLAAADCLSTSVQALLDRDFAHFPRLHGLVSRVKSELISDTTDECMAEVSELLSRERRTDLTLSNSRLLDSYQRAFESLKRNFGVSEDAHSPGLPLNSHAHLTPDDKHFSQADEVEALQVMSNARAYYDLAFRRFADVAALTVEHSLIRRFCSRIFRAVRAALLAHVARDDHHDCGDEWDALLECPHECTEQRSELESQLRKLQDIQSELRLLLPNSTEPLCSEEEGSSLLPTVRDRRDSLLLFNGLNQEKEEHEQHKHLHKKHKLKHWFKK